jgi:DDE family transposase
MGERQNQPFQLKFNTSLKVDFQGSRVTSDGGLILVGELDERLAFGGLIEQHLTDSCRGKNTQFPFADLLRQSVYSRLAGYEDEREVVASALTVEAAHREAEKNGCLHPVLLQVLPPDKGFTRA